jgi:hypothetical protein
MSIFDINIKKKSYIIDNFDSSCLTLEIEGKDVNYIMSIKIKKEHLENYFKYLFLQLNSFINKYNT